MATHKFTTINLLRGTTKVLLSRTYKSRILVDEHNIDNDHQHWQLVYSFTLEHMPCESSAQVLIFPSGMTFFARLSGWRPGCPLPPPRPHSRCMSLSTLIIAISVRMAKCVFTHTKRSNFVEIKRRVGVWYNWDEIDWEWEAYIRWRIDTKWVGMKIAR